jgi:hypothetical protein
MANHFTLKFSLKHLFFATTLCALIVLWFRPHEIVISYSLELPADLPDTVRIQRAVNKELETLDAQEWYRRWHRDGWQGYLLGFLCSPNHPNQDASEEEYVDVFSDAGPVNLFWPGIGDLGRKARHDGAKACRSALRPLVERYGLENVKESMRLKYPIDEKESWSELASLLEPSDEEEFHREQHKAEPTKQSAQNTNQH